MIELTPQQIAAACRARLVSGASERRAAGDAPTRAVADSRELAAGDLFFGLTGERQDGGRFAAQAIAAGAWGVVVSPEHAQEAQSAPGAARVLIVDEPLRALGWLARRWRDELGAGACRVVGITGSTGKTSTKDLLTSMLRPVLGARLHASRENFNTEIGLPLTVLEAAPGSEVLVLEMAMRGMGQIRELASIARPNVGVITNVGPVHLELVGTIERVAEAKAELIAELATGAACIVPAAEEALHPHLRSDVRTLTFAPIASRKDSDPLTSLELVAGAAADIRVLSAQRSGEGIRAEVALGPERQVFEFNFRQAHNVTNALAAIGAAHALGIPLDALAAGAREVRFSSLRGEEISLPGGVLLINDCYNANPISMRAALDHLAAVAAERRAPRTVAVLGEMRELGPSAAEHHRRIGEHAANVGVDLLVAVGGLTEAYTEGFGADGQAVSAADAGEAARLVSELLADGDVLLVKGSRSVGLERVAAELDQLAGRAP